MDKNGGKISISTLPLHLRPIVSDIADLYNNEIVNNSVSTQHTWFNDMNTKIKDKVKVLQNDKFWSNVCDGTSDCINVNVDAMDELYYSNVPNTTKNLNLYGSTTNVSVHRDCIFNFPGIRFYRVLIGLTNGNENVTTYFNDIHVGKKINQNDVVVFDFDKTTHQVIKETDKFSPRIILKLHFIVCENCKHSKEYVERIKHCYINYEYITRHIMNSGTDPTSFVGFFYGLGCQYSNCKYIYWILASVSIMLLFIFKMVLKIKFVPQNLLYILKLLIVSNVSIYLGIVCFYWLRFVLFNIK